MSATPSRAGSPVISVARYFPGQTITDRSRLLVEDLLNPQQ
jgi:hypothetical protein